MIFPVSSSEWQQVVKVCTSHPVLVKPCYFLSCWTIELFVRDGLKNRSKEIQTCHRQTGRPVFCQSDEVCLALSHSTGGLSPLPWALRALGLCQWCTVTAFLVRKSLRRMDGINMQLFCSVTRTCISSIGSRGRHTLEWTPPCCRPSTRTTQGCACMHKLCILHVHRHTSVTQGQREREGERAGQLSIDRL